MWNTARLFLLTASLLAFAVALTACGSEEPTKKPAPAMNVTPAKTVAGVYVLDREDYLRGLLADVDDWIKSVGSQSTPEERPKMLADAQAKARARAASADVKLTMADDGTFKMEIGRGKDVTPLIGHGSWTLDGALLTLETKEVDDGVDEPDLPPPPEDGPPIPDSARAIPLPPPLEATIEGDTLIVKPSIGVPFEHRLVRSR